MTTETTWQGVETVDVNGVQIMEAPNEGKKIKKPAKINVITKEEFEDRVEQVFHILWETLARSFGPYGAPTLICNYPYTHVTKDGFTIMKNVSMDASETMVDQSIANLASDICGRLNYTVGDGTTSAIIATNRIYEAYRKYKTDLLEKYVMPRDVIRRYDALKEIIITELRKQVKPIRSLDLDELAENIREVVYISSNGDELITDYITNFYRELGNPSISCSLAPDGVTKASIINGYSYELTLNDKMYINSDNDTMDLDEADIIIFSIKINKSIYDKILKPLNYECAMRGRHLIVAAPSYDERTLQQTIARDLSQEYKNRRDVNMVLCTYKAFSAHNRRLLEDFAVLTDTTVLDKVLTDNILEKLDAGQQIFQVLNLDSREIAGTRAVGLSEDKSSSAKYAIGSEENMLAKHKMVPINDLLPLIEGAVRVGFSRKISLGLKTSLFGEFVYNQNAYDAILKDAKVILKETEQKYQRLGTFNIEVANAQQRVYALGLKMGLIEVGATSELSQGMLKDAVDDSIKAAASAFDHGVILGCNVTLLGIIYDLLNKYKSIKENCEEDTSTMVDADINIILLSILFDGFFEVYGTVLGNAFSDIDLETDEFNLPLADTFLAVFDKKFKNLTGTSAADLFDKDVLQEVINNLVVDMDKKPTFHAILIMYSIKSNNVFDISEVAFSDKVINSAQTDEEVLNATIDLLSLLITGNQMVVTQKHNF